MKSADYALIRAQDLSIWFWQTVARILSLLSVLALILGIVLLVPLIRFQRGRHDMNTLAQAIRQARYIHARSNDYALTVEFFAGYDAQGRLEQWRLELDAPSEFGPPCTISCIEDSAIVSYPERSVAHRVPPGLLRERIDSLFVDFRDEVEQMARLHATSADQRVLIRRLDDHVEVEAYLAERVLHATFDSRSRLPLFLTEFSSFGAGYDLLRTTALLECAPSAPAGVFDPDLPPQTVIVQGVDQDRYLLGGELACAFAAAGDVP